MGSESGADEPQFLEYVRVLRRRKWWVIAATLLGIAGAGAYAYTAPKQYSATATVLVSATPSASSALPTGTVGAQTLAVDALYVTTHPVRFAVRQQLPFVPSRVVVATVPTSDEITITATGHSAEEVARTANAYAFQYIAYKKLLATTNSKKAAAVIQGQAASLQKQVSTLESQLNGVAKNSVAYTALQNQILSLQGQEAQLTATSAEVYIDSSLSTGGVTVVTRAVAPPLPSSPAPKRDMLFGGLAGLVLGLGVALGADAIDDRIRSRDDLERCYPRLPILGFIPYIEAWKSARTPYLVSTAAPLSSAAEAFRSVRTALQFIRVDRQVKVVLVASAHAGDGKTATVANLGVGMAKAGRAVCIVSADLRRPRLGEFFSVSDDVGLTSVAVGETTLEGALQQVSEVSGLWYLGTGPTPVEAGEFLGSRRTAEVFAELRDRFDIVLIDSPPLLAVADALVMTSYADGVVLVVRQGSSRRRSLSRVRELLGQGDAEVLGAVFSQASAESFGYGYYSGYGRYGYNSYYVYGAEGTKSRRRHAARGRSKDDRPDKRAELNAGSPPPDDDVVADRI